jgi:hypothetical protein
MAFFRYSGDYYVAINGDDANNGTSPESPFATIQAALTAVGSNQNKTIIIGTGIYNEILDTTYTSDNKLTIQGDGDVIITGDGISLAQTNSALNNGSGYFRRSYMYDITFVDWDNVFIRPGVSNQSLLGSQFHRCTFINCNNLFGQNIDQIDVYFFHCTFIKSHIIRMLDRGSNVEFSFCKFLKSSIFGDSDQGVIEEMFADVGDTTFAAQHFDKINDCIFANPFDDEPYMALTIRKIDATQTPYYSARSEFNRNIFSSECIIQSVRDTYFTSETPYRTMPYTQSAAEFIQEMKDNNGNWLSIGGNPTTYNSGFRDANTLAVADLNWNGSELTGSTDLYKTLGNPYSLNFNNTNYYQLAEHPLFRKIANEVPGLGFGTTNTGSNPFHTSGGATWDNIIETGSGFTISSSILISGTIESAVIDQGFNKTLQDIQFNWSTNTGNQGVISYYTSSQAGFATPYTYQLRYSTSSSDLSSEEYKIFPLNDIPYIDINGSGSGDVNFITGSTLPVKGQYLQFKLTLRNNWNG